MTQIKMNLLLTESIILNRSFSGNYTKPYAINYGMNCMV